MAEVGAAGGGGGGEDQLSEGSVYTDVKRSYSTRFKSPKQPKRLFVRCVMLELAAKPTTYRP